MKRKKVATILAVLLVIFFAFFVLFITHEADHDCTGEDCYICKQITICEKTIEELGAGIIKVIIVSATIFGCVYKLLFGENNKIKSESLVALKIEMLN